jgi:hypothetical protein
MLTAAVQPKPVPRRRRTASTHDGSQKPSDACFAAQHFAPLPLVRSHQ